MDAQSRVLCRVQFSHFNFDCVVVAPMSESLKWDHSVLGSPRTIQTSCSFPAEKSNKHVYIRRNQRHRDADRQDGNRCAPGGVKMFPPRARLLIALRDAEVTSKEQTVQATWNRQSSRILVSIRSNAVCRTVFVSHCMAAFDYISVSLYLFHVSFFFKCTVLLL